MNKIYISIVFVAAVIMGCGDKKQNLNAE